MIWKVGTNILLVEIKKIKENKATDESGVIAEYMKALEVEDLEKYRGLINSILNGAEYHKRVESE